MPCAMRERSEPETRTMPIPPRPGGVAIAAITSFGVAMTGPRAHCASAPLGLQRRGLAREHAVHMPLLEDLDRIVDQPVEDESRGEKDEHHRERDRHDLHDLRLDRILDGGRR